MKYFDQDEKDTIESVEKGGWISQKSRIPEIRKIAQGNLKKTEHINIRITMKDLKDVKKLAALDGIPYQTFVSSIIHKYTNGRS
ncbi:MAG: antitoxin [Patescibacteria group bacterium]